MGIIWLFSGSMVVKQLPWGSQPMRPAAACRPSSPRSNSTLNLLLKPKDSAINCSAKEAIHVLHLPGRLSYILPFWPLCLRHLKTAYQACPKTMQMPICPKPNESKETKCKSHRKQRCSTAPACSAHLPTIIGPGLPVPPRRLRGRASARGPMEDGQRTSARPRR